MASTTQRLDWGRITTQALAAGIVGAILIDLYLWVAQVAPAHMPMTGVWQFVASTAFGKAAFANPAFIWIGLLMHVVVSIGWAGGYAYLAATRPFMNERWIISGLVYGIVVLFFMQLILIGSGNFQVPGSGLEFVNLLASHMLFFGVPVAFVVSRMSR